MTQRITALASALALAGLAATTQAAAAPAQNPTAKALPAKDAGTPADAAGPRPPTQNPALQTLAVQARSWADRGRSDLAAAAWRKLLAVDPQNADAHYGLALAEINLGKPDAAAEPLAALKRLRPDHPGLRKLESHLRSGSSDRALLQEARRLASAGQYDAAARQYELLLADPQPQGEIALEYYQTLGGIPNRWDEARAGLERLGRSESRDPRYALALAKHLSYREPSRREAIHQLASIATPAAAGAANEVGGPSPAQRQEARDAWRQALLWLGAKQADLPLFSDFLAGAGDDSSVRARLTELTQGSDEAHRAAEARERDPLVRGRKQGFDALGHNELAAAGERFSRILKERPKDSDALGGLGVVRLREGRYGDARDLLGQAVAASGGSASPWRNAHLNAQVRVLLQQADGARSQQQPRQALELARQASQIDPRDAQAVVAQGDAAQDLAQWPAAEAHYRQALAIDPLQADALRGLMKVLNAQGRPEQARSLIDGFSDERAAKLGGRASLLARQLGLEADGARQAGDMLRAQGLLEDAVRIDPHGGWTRLGLAQFYLAQGQESDARALMDALAAQPAPVAEAWWAQAQWQSDLKEPAAGLAALDRIPVAERTPEMGRLHRRLRVQQRIAGATAQAGQGQMTAALAGLGQAQAEAGREPELLGLVGAAYADLGQSARGLQLLRAALVQDRGRDVATRLQYAYLLQTTRQDAELAGVLNQLASQPLPPPQRQQVDDLRIGLSLRQVDRLRDAGDAAGAYDLLAPLLNERPADSRLALALARLHAGVGDDAQALQIIDSVLQAEPANLDAWLTAAASASKLGEHDYALGALQQADQLSPQNPQVLAQFSRYHRARGELGRAGDYMRAAIAAQRPGSGGARPALPGLGGRPSAVNEAQWGQPLRAANPFVPSAPAAWPQPPATPRTPLLTAPWSGSGAAAVTGDPSPFASTEVWLRGASADASGQRSVTTLLEPPYRETGRRDALPRDLAQLQPRGPGSAPLPFGEDAPAWAGATPALNAALPAPAGRVEAPRSLNDELAEIIAERGTRQAEAGASLRWRSGESGTSQLVEVRTPLEFQSPVGDLGRVHVRVVPTLLEAGQIGIDRDQVERFGSLALGSAGSSENISAAGVGISVGFEGRHVSADLGSTPLGFEIVNAVGGLRVGGEIAPQLSLSGELSRRAVTDSVLSYAGARDPRSGRIWGGVVATGVRGSLDWRDSDLKLYSFFGTQVLQGQGVKDNTRIELGAGSSWRMQEERNQRMDVGLQLGYQHYQRNLRHFTLGHGGYFSPQQNVTLSVPITLIGQQGKLRWSFSGAPGLNAWREDSAVYFPNDAAAQAQLTTAVGLGLAQQGVYAARNSVGLSMNLQGAAEYRLNPRLVLGSRLALENASQYTQMSGALYLRLNFEPEVGGRLLVAPAPLHE